MTSGYAWQSLLKKGAYQADWEVKSAANVFAAPVENWDRGTDKISAQQGQMA
jgi:hypothetical protein